MIRRPDGTIPWLTPVVFAAGAATVLGVMGWVTHHALRLERNELAARTEAQRQEAIRQALWRMEFALSPVIAREAGRLYFEYQAFYPADRAYTRMLEAVRPGEVLVPSPLLRTPGEYVRLHFQDAPDAGLTSPQAPVGNLRDLAESAYVDHDTIVRSEARLGELARLLHGPAAPQFELGLDNSPAWESSPAQSASQTLSTQSGIGEQRVAQALQEFAAREELANRYRNVTDLTQQRSARPQGDRAEDPPAEKEAEDAKEGAAAPAVGGAGRRGGAPPVASAPAPPPRPGPGAPSPALGAVADKVGAAREPDAEEGERDRLDRAPPAEPMVLQEPLVPEWRLPWYPSTGDPQLLFVRNVVVDATPLRQGIWVDWPALRAHLLDAARDVLPGASLLPVLSAEERAGAIGAGLLLAGIPARLVPPSVVLIAPAAVTPARVALGLGWIALLGSITTIGLVLRAAVRLGERRGRFVSAVTHELRTPLTTFCLYSQMLADGMIADDARPEYTQTLKRESTRLARIVEDVLEYARLGRAANARGHLPGDAADARALGDALMAAAGDRVARDARQLEARVEVPAGCTLRADPATVGRIVANLIDNACKYAADADDRRIHLSVTVRARHLAIEIADHGPGIEPRDRARVFGAFQRSRRDADHAKPGLGLGLALARGLARELGGDLAYLERPGWGAVFELTIPLAREGP